MITSEDLDAAVSDGILTGETAIRLKSYAEARRVPEIVDEENFRLVTGFNDIFVSIALLLVLASIQLLPGEAGNPVVAACTGVLSWILAEQFTRKRRMALPSIILAIAFAGSAYAAVAWFAMPRGADHGSAWLFAFAFAAVAGASWGHWIRFGVPITVALTAVGAIGAASCLVLAAVPGLLRYPLPIVFASGTILFAIALRWDSSDRARKTRRSDAAFWLHLAAAPLLVHPLFASLRLVEGIISYNPGPMNALAGVAIYMGLAALALAIDRRALLVSGLIYALAAIATLVKSTGSMTTTLSLTALTVGSGLLMLSIWWHPMRVRLVAMLPGRLQGWVPAI